MAEPYKVGAVIVAALEQAGPGLTGQWRITEPFRRSGLAEALLNSLVNPNPLTRAAAARLCGALRLTGSVMWLADPVQDKNPHGRDAAIPALGLVRGRRSVGGLISAADQSPPPPPPPALPVAPSLPHAHPSI